MSSCGHDACELCLSRWVVDQGKRSCPSCRQSVAAKLPGICRRLQRTIAALFPRRLEERRAERGQERAALAAEKQAGAEARRHERAARQASADERGQLMQVQLMQGLGVLLLAAIPQVLFSPDAGYPGSTLAAPAAPALPTRRYPTPWRTLPQHPRVCRPCWSSCTQNPSSGSSRVGCPPAASQPRRRRRPRSSSRRGAWCSGVTRCVPLRQLLLLQEVRRSCGRSNRRRRRSSSRARRCSKWWMEP